MSVDSFASSTNSFEKYLNVNVKMLRWIGLTSFNVDFTKEKIQTSIWEVIFVVGSVSLSAGFGLTCVAANAIVNWNTNPVYAIESVCCLLCATGSMAKGLRLCQKRVELGKLLHNLQKLWHKSWEEPSHRQILTRIGKIGYAISCFYVINCLGILCALSLNPCGMILQQYFTTKTANNSYNFTAMSPAIYPIDYDDPTQYVFLILLENFMGYVTVMYTAVNESLFCQLVCHLIIHFKLLSCNFKDVIATKSGRTDTVELVNTKNAKQLIRLIKHQNKLYLYCRLVEEIFSPIIFYIVVTCSILMCLSLLQICDMVSGGNYFQCLKYSFIFLQSISQLVIYCGFAQVLTDEIKLVADAAYSCNWIGSGRRFTTTVAIILIRAQTPFYLTAYTFFPLTLELLTAFFSTAASYFTILKTVV